MRRHSGDSRFIERKPVKQEKGKPSYISTLKPIVAALTASGNNAILTIKQYPSIL